MKKDKAILIFWICFSVLLLSLFTVLVIGGTADGDDDMVVVGALGLIFLWIHFIKSTKKKFATVN